MKISPESKHSPERTPETAHSSGQVPGRKFTALLVMDASRRGALADLLQKCDAELVEASDCQGACSLLDGGLNAHVIVVDHTLADGDWRAVLAGVFSRKVPAEVIVCCPDGGIGFWCEVIQSGAYDVLSEPWEPASVIHTIEGAAARSLYCPPPRAMTA